MNKKTNPENGGIIREENGRIMQIIGDRKIEVGVDKHSIQAWYAITAKALEFYPDGGFALIMGLSQDPGSTTIHCRIENVSAITVLTLIKSQLVEHFGVPHSIADKAIDTLIAICNR